MTDTTAPEAADIPFFRALLTPHRSLGRRGFLILMSTLGIGWLVTGLIFLSQGAWPVFGFFGLDVLLLYLAFRANYRAARIREEISVSRTMLEVRKVAATGRSALHRFNPIWTRFSVSRHEEIGIMEMALVSRSNHVPIGRFLNPDDRESFAKAFGHALAQARSR